MPINAGHEYFAAEGKYNQALTTEEKIKATEEMIKTAPKHKGSENLLAPLKTRLKKLKVAGEKAKKAGKSSHKVIKKEGFQIVLIGPPNTGKSSLLTALTNAKPKISEHPFTTQQPEVGTLEFKGVKAQLIDFPSIGAASFNTGLLTTADLVIAVITSLTELPQVTPLLERTYGKKLIAINKSDLLTDNELRKTEATIRSKKIPAMLISVKTRYNLDFLQEALIKRMDCIRIYLKEPNKPASTQPMILPQQATVEDCAEKILNGFAERIKETRITGPSSKFAKQRVGLSHVLKDKDTVEFHTNWSVAKILKGIK